MYTIFKRQLEEVIREFKNQQEQLTIEVFLVIQFPGSGMRLGVWKNMVIYLSQYYSKVKHSNYYWLQYGSSTCT